MQFKINCSPHLKMEEITKNLFNCKFLSDIQFAVGDKIIYAHSWELMKRSVVFEHQLLETMNEKKLIPITDCSYESFLEFIRFIYTDDCEINDDNGIELLRLAVKYKIIMLENQVINLGSSLEWCAQLFEHSVIDKYEFTRNFSKIHFAYNYGKLLNTKKYVSLHQDAINDILQFDEVKEGVTEVQIFNALAKWIDNFCKTHEMSLPQGRERFDELIKKIRFPTMTIDEIRECVKKYPGILNDSDCMSLGLQLFGSGSVTNNLWISQRRGEYKSLHEMRNINRNTPFLTTFSVSKDTILHGLWIGVEKGRKEIEIEITAKDIKTLECKNIVFTQSSPYHWNSMLISLGDSIVLKPNLEYAIAVKYLQMRNEYRVRCRIANTDLILEDPENSIQNLKASDNMLEMHFKSAPE